MDSSSLPSVDGAGADVSVAVDPCNRRHVNKRDGGKKADVEKVEDYAKLFSHRVFLDVREHSYPTKNVGALAKDSDITTTGMHYYTKAMRKWNADTWLKALTALGAIKIEHGKIIIYTSIANEFVVVGKKIVRAPVRRKKKGRTKRRKPSNKPKTQDVVAHPHE